MEVYLFEAVSAYAEIRFLKGGLRFQTASMVSCPCFDKGRCWPAAAERFGCGIGKPINERYFMSGKLTRSEAAVYRLLTLADRPDETVEVLFGKPFAAETGEWVCPCRIVGAGGDMCFRVFGADGVQALQLSFAVIDGAMAGKGLRLLWDGEAFGGFTATAF